MKLFKRLLGVFNLQPSTLNLSSAAWPEQRRKLRERLAQLPEHDPLLVGLLGWQEDRLLKLLRQCDNPDLTGEQALSLAHRMAETAAFREDLERVWKEERAKLERG